jgi:energy-converting hydrogenase Eha subunit B
MPMRSKKLAWHHPGWYALILINLLIYAIVGSLVSKRVKVEFGLCEEHTAKRRNIIIASWAIFFGSLGTAFFLGTSIDNPDAAIGIGLLGFLVAVILGLVGGRSIYAKRITEDEVRIAGCGEPFLESAMKRVKF